PASPFALVSENASRDSGHRCHVRLSRKLRQGASPRMAGSAKDAATAASATRTAAGVDRDAYPLEVAAVLELLLEPAHRRNTHSDLCRHDAGAVAARPSRARRAVARANPNPPLVRAAERSPDGLPRAHVQPLPVAAGARPDMAGTWQRRARTRG